MKKNLLTLVLCSFAFGLGFGMNNVAFSNAALTKVAYVNVAKLLSTSKTLKTAEQTRAKQTQDMLKWYDNANAEIMKQQDKQAKKDLIKKYEAQLTQKKKSIKDAYAKKVLEVDKQLDAEITKQAKDMGYTLVLRKESVLFGGVDITDKILPSVK